MAEPSKLHTFYHRYLPLLVFLALVVWAILIRLVGDPHPPIGTYIAFLAFGAAIVTIWPPEGRWGKVCWLLVFAGFLAFEVMNLYHDRAEHDAQMLRARSEADAHQIQARIDADARQIAAQKELQQGFSSIIQTQQKSFAEMLGENQKQFTKTLKSTEAIQTLAQESIKTMTGGDSFLYMQLSPQFSSKGLTPVFFHVGREPLYDTHVRIVDIQKFHELLKRNNGRILSLISEADLLMPIGNMRPNAVYIPGEYGQIILAGDSQAHDFNIYYDARNGDWSQQLQLRRVGKEWSQASRVFRWTGMKYILMCQEVPKDFPGVPDWTPLQGVKFTNAKPCS
jgi:hypothetical protein